MLQFMGLQRVRHNLATEQEEAANHIMLFTCIPHWSYLIPALRTVLCFYGLILVLFSHLGMSDSLQPHGLQHARPPCPSLCPRVCSDSCPLSQWCHPAISSSVTPFSSCPQSFLASGSFLADNESALCIRWPKYWSFSFSISPYNEYSGLISFRID